MKKNVGWGIILIVIAVLLLTSKMGVFPEFSLFTVIFTIVFAYSAIQGIFHKSFTQTIFSVALLGCIYDEQLGIEAITPWSLLIAALLIGIGLDMIFKNVLHKHQHYGYVGGTSQTSEYVDGDYVHFDNNFGSAAKYINANHFTGADIDNSFGSLTVYFDNAIMANAVCDVRIENSFGETNLYFPRTWRVETRHNAAFGDVKFKNQGSMESDAPLVRLNAESSFGVINIYFN